MAEPESYRLLEFVPKTCFLPADRAEPTLRRSNSADGRIEHPSEAQQVQTRVVSRVRSREKTMYPERRSYGGRGNMGYEMDSYKQPLMHAPLFVLMPATGSGGMDYYPGRGGGMEAMYGGGGMGGMDANRRRACSRREMEYGESQRRREKGCCSCWRCAIATIIILAILGVGAAVAGIVFITLISDGTMTPTIARNATATTERSAVEVLSFDISAENSTDVVFLPSNSSFDLENTTLVVSPAIKANLTTILKPTPSSGVFNISAPPTAVLAFDMAPSTSTQLPMTSLASNTIVQSFDVTSGTSISDGSVLVVPGNSSVTVLLSTSSASQPVILTNSSSLLPVH